MMATTRKIHTRFGTPRKEPRIAVLKSATSTIWVCLLEMISATPRADTIMARVAMKATMRPYATRMPLTTPQPRPTIMAVKGMISQVDVSAICCVATVVDQMVASPSTAPTDRSMPPVVITNVMPIASTPIAEARRRMVSTLSTLANRSPEVAMPTMISSTSATTRPMLRNQEPDGRGCLARGGAEAWLASAADGASLMPQFLP